MRIDRMPILVCFAGALLAAVGVTLSTPVSSRGASSDKSQAHGRVPQAECSFSDGSTITFGRQAWGASAGLSVDAWRTGPYAATAFRVSERMLIPPVDSPTEIPAGNYTLFVVDKGQPPWTLIISKKSGAWGMSYPGKEYDVGRAQLGSDVQPPVENFVIGCFGLKNTAGPIFLWMQSGKQVAYTKVLAESVSNGETTLLIH